MPNGATSHEHGRPRLRRATSFLRPCPELVEPRASLEELGVLMPCLPVLLFERERDGRNVLFGWHQVCSATTSTRSASRESPFGRSDVFGETSAVGVDDEGDGRSWPGCDSGNIAERVPPPVSPPGRGLRACARRHQRLRGHDHDDRHRRHGRSCRRAGPGRPSASEWIFVSSPSNWCRPVACDAAAHAFPCQGAAGARWALRRRPRRAGTREDLGPAQRASRNSITTSRCPRGGPCSGVLEDVVVPDSAPTAPRFAVDGDELERGPAVRAGERPRHLQHAGRRADRPDAQRCWPGCRGIRGEGVTRGTNLWRTTFLNSAACSALRRR